MYVIVVVFFFYTLSHSAAGDLPLSHTVFCNTSDYIHIHVLETPW